jgi:raffinose/stachyose/melibiose transport system permease protein
MAAGACIRWPYARISAKGVFVERVLRDKKAIVVFILPAFASYLIFMIYPIFRSLYFSFFEGVPNVNFSFVGLKNFEILGKDAIFINSVKVTVQYVLITASGLIILGFLAALLVMFGVKKINNLARTILYMPVVIPAVGVAAMFSKIYEIQPNYGLVNSILEAVGLGNLCKAWAGGTSTALAAVCIADIWHSLGYYMVIFYAGLVNVPKELIEAARIDGANTIQTIRRVVMPIMRPVTVMAIVLCLNNTFKVYDMPTVLTGGGPGRATYMLSLNMYQMAFSQWRYGYASVIAVVMMAVTLVVTQLITYIDARTDSGVV